MDTFCTGDAKIAAVVEVTEVIINSLAICLMSAWSSFSNKSDFFSAMLSDAIIVADILQRKKKSNSLFIVVVVVIVVIIVIMMIKCQPVQS